MIANGPLRFRGKKTNANRTGDATKRARQHAPAKSKDKQLHQGSSEPFNRFLLHRA